MDKGLEFTTNSSSIISSLFHVLGQDGECLINSSSYLTWIRNQYFFFTFNWIPEPLFLQTKRNRFCFHVSAILLQWMFGQKKEAWLHQSRVYNLKSKACILKAYESLPFFIPFFWWEHSGSYSFCQKKNSNSPLSFRLWSVAFDPLPFLFTKQKEDSQKLKENIP